MSERIGRLTSTWTRVNGLRLHARASVDAAPTGRVPVVLIHGLVVSSRYMVPTAERLAPYYPAYALDLPGFGESDHPRRALSIPALSDTVAAWMDAVGLERAALLGNSLGCQVAVDFAVRYPDRIARAILVGPTVDPGGRTTLQQGARLVAVIPWERFSLQLVLARDFLDAGVGQFLGTLRWLLRDRIEDKLPYVQAPTLVVRGSHDWIVPRRWAQSAADCLPTGRLVEVTGAGHALNYSAPRELVRVVRPFLTSGD